MASISCLHIPAFTLHRSQCVARMQTLPAASYYQLVGGVRLTPPFTKRGGQRLEVSTVSRAVYVTLQPSGKVVPTAQVTLSQEGSGDCHARPMSVHVSSPRA